MRRGILVAAIALAGLGALALRVVIEGRRALADGDRAAARDDVREALAAWESAARWYLPGAPHVDDAYERLTALAARDPAHALAAFRAVRSASLATTSLWTPHAGDLAIANTAIARLATEDPARSPALGSDPAMRLEWHRAQLERARGPSGGAVALALAGILAWLAGVGLLVRRALDAAGRLARRPALIGAALTAAGLAAWALGLYSA